MGESVIQPVKWDVPLVSSSEIREHLVSKQDDKRIVAEVPWVEDVTCGCQTCNGNYKESDVMMVDDVGPICGNCLYHLAYKVLGDE